MEAIVRQKDKLHFRPYFLRPKPLTFSLQAKDFVRTVLPSCG